MEKKTKTVTKTINIYVTKDGREFESSHKALRYEWELTAPHVWVVTPRGRSSHRGVDIFTTEELAVAYVDGRELYEINKQFLNETIWQKMVEDWE